MRQGGRPTRSDCNFFAEMAGFALHITEHRHRKQGPKDRARAPLAVSPCRPSCSQSSLDQFQLTHCTLPHPPLPVCSAYPFHVHLPAATRHRYRVEPHRPTSLPCPSPAIPHVCRATAGLVSRPLPFVVWHSSSCHHTPHKTSSPISSALPQSWSTLQTTPVTMQAAPNKKRRRSTDDDAEGQSEPVDKVCEIDTLKTAISDSLTSNSESTSHPRLVLELRLSMATSGFLQQPISVLSLSAEQVRQR